jgi:hypothetical protein
LGSFETASGGSSRSGSSVEASLHSLGREEEDEEGAEELGSAVRAVRTGSGSVSAELRRSSSATSQELENLLSQLSAYEAHLLEEQAPGLRASAGGSSMSWSQTLAGVSPALQQQPTPLANA